MTRSLGRYLKTSELLDLDRLPVSDEHYCIADVDQTTTAPSEVFVLSHRWQSRDDPDPSGLTFRIVTTYLHELMRIDGEFWPLDEEVDRKEALRLLELRASVPIFTAPYLNDYETVESLIDSESFKGFVVLSWIRDSVDAVLEAHWWIDCYALPHPAHRQSCERCTRLYPLLLQRIPDVIATSTCFSVASRRDVERGWIQLETCVASTAKRLIKHHVHDWDAFDLRHRMALGDYTCTEAQDAWYIPRAYALHRIVETAAMSSLVARDPNDAALLETVRRQVAPLLGLNTSGANVDVTPTDAIQRVLEYVISDECQDVVHRLDLNHPLADGGFLVDMVGNCTMAILVSNCVRQGRRLRTDVSPLNAALAAIMQVLCVEDCLEPFDAALAIAELWVLQCLETGDGSALSERRRALTSHLCRHLAMGHRFVLPPEVFGGLTSPGHRLHLNWRTREWARADRSLDKCAYSGLQYFLKHQGHARSCHELG